MIRSVEHVVQKLEAARRNGEGSVNQ